MPKALHERTPSISAESRLKALAVRIHRVGVAPLVGAGAASMQGEGLA